MAKKAQLTVVTTAQPPKMMRGSSGKFDYFAFARKGDVVLGIKPEGAAAGEGFGVKGTVYFAARLRSAPSHGLFAEEDAAKKVVTLQKQPENLWDAWPGVTWMNKSQERASTTVGVFIRGSFNPSKPEQMEQLLENIGEGKLTSKMAEYLIQLAGEENAICTVDELKTWLDGVFDARIAQIVEMVQKAQQVTEAFEESVGNFGMQAALLNKIYAAKKAAKGVPEYEPEDDKHDEDGDQPPEAYDDED